MAAHRFTPIGPLRGRIEVPGDKSISHRALMFAGLAVGESRITGLLEGEDVFATAAAMRQFGARIERERAGEPFGQGENDGDGGTAGGKDQHGTGSWRVSGVGVGSLLEPETALDMGNSGTSTRLLMGLLASHALTATFIGDASLSRRPMNRVIEPLGRIGASIEASAGGTLPAMLRGAARPAPITYRLPVPSAQVKSAVLLAGLNTPGITTIIEPVATRDHTERMLEGFGAKLEFGEENGARTIAVHGEADLRPCDIAVPGDPSSAAFFIVAALIMPGSDLTIANVGLNPTRTGLITVLLEMGASIEEVDRTEIGGEPVADLRVRSSALRGIDIAPSLAPSMIDEFPILFVAAALAEGTTRTSGLGELRVKESDRIAAMARALEQAGARVEEREDGLDIEGTGGERLRGTLDGERITVHHDHRIAMAMAVAGLASRSGVEIDDLDPVATSFPGFVDLLNGAMAGGGAA